MAHKLIGPRFDERGIVRIGHALSAGEATHRMYQNVDTSGLGHDVIGHLTSKLLDRRLLPVIH